MARTKRIWLVVGVAGMLLLPAVGLMSPLLVLLAGLLPRDPNSLFGFEHLMPLMKIQQYLMLTSMFTALVGGVIVFYIVAVWFVGEPEQDVLTETSPSEEDDLLA